MRSRKYDMTYQTFTVHTRGRYRRLSLLHWGVFHHYEYATTSHSLSLLYRRAWSWLKHMCRPLGVCLPLKIRGNLIYKHFPIWDLCTWDILKFCMFVCMWVYGSFFEHSKHEKKRKGLCLTSHVILKGPQKRTADMFHLLALTVFSTVLQPSVHAVVVWYSVSVELILLQISCYRAFVFTVCKNNYNCECLFQG